MGVCRPPPSPGREMRRHFAKAAAAAAIGAGRTRVFISGNTESAMRFPERRSKESEEIFAVTGCALSKANGIRAYFRFAGPEN
jgi:hypothetical protein